MRWLLLLVLVSGCAAKQPIDPYRCTKAPIDDAKCRKVSAEGLWPQ